MDRKLYRSREHRIIAGVCGGLGAYFDIDPVIVRALFIVATLTGGFGVLVYLIMWVVVPEEAGEVSGKKGVEEAKAASEGGERSLGAIVLIVLGLLFLFNNFMPHWNMHRLWPLILVAIGFVLLGRKG